MSSDATVPNSSNDDSRGLSPGVGDCWNTIGVSGDLSCPELNTHIHCRNCPIFAGAARSFFERRAPEGYLVEWSHWLAESTDSGLRGDAAEVNGENLLSQ